METSITKRTLEVIKAQLENVATRDGTSFRLQHVQVRQSERRGGVMSDVNQFIETGLWSTLDYCNGDDNKNPPLDENYSVDDVNEAFKIAAEKFIDAFMDSALELFTPEELNHSNIAHDLWLTVEGHGAGFWDGDYKRGDELTAIVKRLYPYDSHWGDLLNESIKRGENDESI